jgi:hypothetical protein
MHARQVRWGVLIIAALTGTSLLFASVVGCGGGTTGATNIDDVWDEIKQANENINSLHREIAIYYENTQFGSGQVESMITDSNGEDVYDRTLIFDQVISEDMYFNGKQYSKDVTTNKWEEVPVISNDIGSNEYGPQLLDLLSQASSKQYVGEENIAGKQVKHWHFSLGPAFATSMLVSQPPFDLSQNTGSDVDLWIADNNFYIMRCEIVIHDVLITNEIGTGDLRFVINFSKINEPIEITSPI